MEPGEVGAEAGNQMLDTGSLRSVLRNLRDLAHEAQNDF